MLSELRKIDSDITNTVTGMDETSVKKHFTDAFDAHTYINFTGGFLLTETEFSEFAQNADLNIRHFEKYLGSHDQSYKVNKKLLTQEKEARLMLLHTIGTVHLQELHINQLELLPEKEKTKINLQTNSARGIAKRILVNIKNDTTTWMLAKMRVRRNLLHNFRNRNVLLMLRHTMWSPDIFPKTAFDDLRSKNPGNTNLESLLGISPNIPMDNLMRNNIDSNIQHQNKRQKTNYNQQYPAGRNNNNNNNNNQAKRNGSRPRGRGRGGQPQYRSNYQTNRPQTLGRNNDNSNNRASHTKNKNQPRKSFQKGKNQTNKQ